MQNISSINLKKKQSKGISELCKLEQRSFKDLVCETTTKNIIIIHFGPGDDIDFFSISKYIDNFTNEYLLEVYPGYCYAVAEFKSTEDTKKLIDSTKGESVVINYENQARNTFIYYTPLAFDEFKVRKTLLEYQTSQVNALKTPNLVDGLQIYNNFILDDTQRQLKKMIDEQDWKSTRGLRAQVYNKIPEFFKNLAIYDEINNICKSYNKGFDLNELVITDFYAKDGTEKIMHTHSKYHEAIALINLYGGYVNSFKNHEGLEENIFFESGSQVQLTGESRYRWQNWTEPRKFDKVDNNIKFRKSRVTILLKSTRETPCDCKFTMFCNSQGFEYMKKDDENFGTEINTEKSNLPGNIEKQYVYDVYEKIASHFSSTRYKPWNKVAEFLESLEEGSQIHTKKLCNFYNQGSNN